jgi:hypothetical protein
MASLVIACVLAFEPEQRQASQQRMIDAARVRCLADPQAVSTNATIVAFDGLRASCDRPDRGPPCIAEAFFHADTGRGVNWLGQSGRDFSVCAQRPKYADWPTFEPHTPRDRGLGDGVTKRASDIASLSPSASDVTGLRRGLQLLVIGASTAQQLHDAALCQLASTPPGLALHMPRWQFARVNRVNEMLHGTCRGARASGDANVLRECETNATALAERFELYPADVIVAAFDPQHYGGSNLNLPFYSRDMRTLARALQLWVSHGPRAVDGRLLRAGFMREGGALHFVDAAAYGTEPAKWATESDAERAAERRISACRCVRRADSEWSARNPFWRAALALNAEARPAGVHVIAFYNATIARTEMHKADMCSYRHARVHGIARPPARRLGINPIRRCCDCLHMCYSPAFYDQAFFTPIWRTLVEQHGYATLQTVLES